MDGMMIIVGGYWRASKDLLKQVDHDMAPEDRGVDYIVRFKNLPNNFLDVEKVPVIKYYCKTCEKPVPEWEVEQKIGCFVHHQIERRIEYRMEYRPGYIDVVPEELAKRRPIIRGAIRVDLGNPQGHNILQQIFDYVKKTYPAGKQIPDPVMVGTRTGWLLDDINSIPTWELPELEKEEKKEEVKIDEILCPHCDYKAKNKQALRMHIMKAHPEIYKEKYAKKDE